ncbi:hypothetical protein BDF14DRAFT_1321788 [Spinellus fusiger]|nr:hypothetical protein BDF14DRAFT_1321788 [Spinellus fusiger]
MKPIQQAITRDLLHDYSGQTAVPPPPLAPTTATQALQPPQLSQLSQAPPLLCYPHLPYPPATHIQPLQPLNLHNPALYYKGMSENVESKRIRISRACDTCRRKKTKCITDGHLAACRNCLQCNIECTYNDK